MPRSDPTIHYFQNKRPDFRMAGLKVVSPSVLHKAAERLTWSFPSGKAPMTDERFAEILVRSSVSDAQFFLDTCFLTARELAPALLKSLLRLRIVITPQIWGELQPWLEDPCCNRDFRDELLKAEREGHPSIVFLKPGNPDSPLEKAISYYVQLLGLRKRIFQLVRNGLRRELGRVPTELEIEKSVQKQVQDRGWLLACKGRDDAHKPNLLADEMTLVRAVVNGITSGVETSVLTRDRDLTEQFYKLLHIIDTHYRSMLIGDACCEQPLNFFDSDLPNAAALKQAFVDGILLHVPVAFETRVLPLNYDPVNLRVYRFVGQGADAKVVEIGFCAERQIARLLQVKGTTGGRSVDQFEDDNLHLCIHPKHQDLFSGCVALAKDQLFSSDEVDISIVDAEVALTREERHGLIVPAEGNLGEGGAVDDEMSTAWNWVNSHVDGRLAFFLPGDWLETTDRQLMHAVNFLPRWAQFSADVSFLTSELPTGFHTALTRSHISTTTETVRAVSSSGQFLEGSLAQIGLDGDRGRWLRKVPRPDKEQKACVAFDQYLAFLAHRKLFGTIIERELREQLGRLPTDEEWRSEITSIGNGAGLLRAIDGRRRRDDARLFDDELNVVTAIMDAIFKGRDTILLTRRREVMEQFVTLCITLERDYRAWAMAEKMHEFLNKYPPQGAADLTKIGFDGVARIMKFERGGPDEMLPKSAYPVQVQCWLFEGDSDSLRILRVAFLAERPMHRMFEVKAETGGKSTNRLGDRSLYYLRQLGPDGLVEKALFGRITWTDIGSNGFPADERLDLVISRVPTFELVEIENNGDGVVFPWSDSTGLSNPESS